MSSRAAPQWQALSLPPAIAPPERAIPILHTPDLERSVQQYCGEFGFERQQAVRGVLAIVRLGALRLHLWQVPAGFRPGVHRVLVADAASLHAALSARAPAALSGPPVLEPWSALEFVLTDRDQNRLHCVQWIA